MACAALVACGGGGATASGAGASGGDLKGYLAQVEPIRLGVNRLLEAADPILAAFRGHVIGRATAAQRMDLLERRFAQYTVAIAAVRPRSPALRRLHAEYAHTYVLEDAYLSALASGLASGELSGLPDTQAAQRAAIVGWRTGVTVMARAAHVSLPLDLQQAGRGEIAPSPFGGS